MPTRIPLPSEFHRDAGRLAVITVVLLCCAFAGEVADILINLHIASVADGLVHQPSTVTTEQIHQLEQLRDFDRLLMPALMLAAAIPFLIWFRRTRENAESFGPGAIKSDPGWAVGCWFVPVVFLWAPLRVVHDIRRASALPGGRDVLTARLVNTWWTLWLATTMGAPLLGVVLDGIYLDRASDTADVGAVSIEARAVANIVAGGFGTLAAAAAVLVVRALTAQQRLRAARQAPQARPEPAVGTAAESV
ncbi:DUF4328 domain-containing protein [Streptomyces sp. NPDC049040]|uniref:DUF4328 domain-containing protein n=1 Tax=Streptomyces sp. NPDC049040 TaxID=3365593 RepID=UPI00371760F1